MILVSTRFIMLDRKACDQMHDGPIDMHKVSVWNTPISLC